MTYREAMALIHRTDWKGSKLGLSRIRELLFRIGDPQKKLRFVHIAGTNGKGSVSSLLAAVLSQAGYRTGLYTSPYLTDFRERIRVGDTLISQAELCRGMEVIAPALEEMADSPTEFEVTTALAFWYFQKCACDVVVCEVGLGGEFDATNVIEDPLVCVITSVKRDHTEILGDTISLIARAKAGILKPNAPALYGEGETNKEVQNIIERRANELSCRVRYSDPSALVVSDAGLWGARFSYRGEEYRIALAGAYQPYNAMIALDALAILKARGWMISREAIDRGFAAARWPGRFEPLSFSDPVVVIDGAHNPNGIAALCASLESCFPAHQRFCAVAAVMADKDYESMFSLIAPRIERLFATAPSDTPRALDAKKLAAVCGEYGIASLARESVFEAVKQALEYAKAHALPVLIFGSLYLYREAREAAISLLPSAP